MKDWFLSNNSGLKSLPFFLKLKMYRYIIDTTILHNMSEYTYEHVGGIHISQLTRGRCLRLVKSNGNLLPQIPKHLRTDDVLYAAVKSSPNVIKRIPPDEITNEMFEIAYSKDRSVLAYKPDANFDYTQCLAMFRKREMPLTKLLANTPEEHLQYVCNNVTNHNIDLFHQIPERFRNKEMVIKAISSKVKDVVKCIPKELLDQEMYEVLARHSCIQLSDIPDEFINTRVAEYFLYLDSTYIKKLPERLITKDLIIKCICQSRFISIQDCPSHLLDEDVYKIYFAVKKNIHAVPVKYWTEDMVMIYYAEKSYYQKSLYFDHLPDHLKTARVRMLMNAM